MSLSSQYLVVPGQVITTSSEDGNDENSGGGFLRGHGTYVERFNNISDNSNSNSNEVRLIASVAGTVERVNKLISVIPFSSAIYTGHVGDLIVGRIISVGSNRWKVQVQTNGKDAQLPLSGVHLPGGIQRIRTSQDERNMSKLFFKVGDLVSAEIHNMQNDGTIVLHTRSMRYGKLENGCLVCVAPSLIPRRKNHYISMLGLDILWGTNGYIWIQRALPDVSSIQEHNKEAPIAEIQETLKAKHASTPVLPDERQKICRVRNSIECLSLVHSTITPEFTERVYNESIQHNVPIKDMLHPDNIIMLTSSCRKDR